MRKAAAVILCSFLLASCQNRQQPAAPEPPVQRKTYTVVQDGKLAGIHLYLEYDQSGSATFKTHEGKKVVYHGTFRYQEE